MNRTRFLLLATAIASIYFVLTYAFMPISFGPLQVRVSEALTVLPVFTPAAVPGLFVGCLISNLLMTTIGPIDVVLGSFATLTAGAYPDAAQKQAALAPLPPVLVNAVAVGLELHWCRSPAA